MTDRRFAERHRRDSGFYLLFIGFAWLMVGMGFAPSVSRRLAGEADYPAPPILEAHVFAFVGWLVLLTVQLLLVRADRRDLHRRLGLAGMLLAPVMVVTAIGAEIYSQRFYSPKYPENLQFFIAPLVQMAVFALCAGAAFACRRNSAAHKRLILLATAMALVAASNRWWGDALYGAFGDGFWGMIIHNFAGPNLLMAVLIGHDLLTRGRIHPVYALGVPLILMAELATSAIYHAPGWPAVARQLVGL